MDTRFITAIKRNFAILFFVIYDFLLIFIGGHIEVTPTTDNIFRFNFVWNSNFVVNGITLGFLLVLPFIISYFTAISSITANSRMVQIIGPKSLMRNIELEFHIGNPERRGELNEENIKQHLSEMARGEPEGTFENLELLFNAGVLVKSLLKDAGVKSVKRVYVSDDFSPNAFTLRIIPMPFVGQDWIIINRNVFDILDPDEIRAVVAHEIGHAVRKDSWVNSILYSPRLVIIFAWSVLLARMASYILGSPFSIDIILRIISLLMLFVLLRVLMNAGLIFTSFAYRKAELLSDFYAAKLVGSDTLINALVKIGQRAEVIRTISTELKLLSQLVSTPETGLLAVRLLHMLEANETSKENAQNLTINVFVQMYLMEVFRGLRINIDKAQFDELVRSSVANIQKDRGINVENKQIMIQHGGLKELTTNWKDVDVDKNQKLDPTEIELLIKELKQGKKLFETEALETLGMVQGTPTHPQFSDRIIFLYENLLKEKQ